MLLRLKTADTSGAVTSYLIVYLAVLDLFPAASFAQTHSMYTPSSLRLSLIFLIFLSFSANSADVIVPLRITSVGFSCFIRL